MKHTLNEQTDLRVLAVDVGVIERNLAQLKRHLPHSTQLMVVVKNNGYGLGMVEYARRLAQAGVKMFGVATTDELVQLRQAGIDSDVFVIHAPPWEAEILIEHNAHAAISDHKTLERLETAAKKLQRKCMAHLFVNTGMNRHGCSLESAPELARRISQSPHLEPAGILTHLVAAEDPAEDAFTRQQLSQFHALTQRLREEGICFQYMHTSNTAGSLRFDQAQNNLVRVGLAPLGVLPSAACRQQLNLPQAVTLKTQIVGTQECGQGDTVGYGRAYKVKTDQSKIAVIPMGYGDGLVRSASDRYRFIVKNTLVPVAGNICMDYTMLDVSAVSEVQVGDSVTLFAPELSVESQANNLGLIPHEVLTSVGLRVMRRFVG